MADQTDKETASPRHILTKRTARALDKAKPNERGLLAPPGAEMLPVLVRTARVPRALTLLDALVNAVEAKGYRFEPDEHGTWRFIVVNGEKVGFVLCEKVSRYPHVTTPEERAARQARRKLPLREQFKHWNSEPTWDYISNGALFLELGGSHTGLRRTWKDGSTLRIEDMLDSFLTGVEVHAAAQIAQRQEAERWKREREEAEKRRMAEQRRRAREEDRVKFLDEHIRLSRRISRLETFLATLEPKVSDAGMADNAALSRFIGWAQAHLEFLRGLSSPAELQKAIQESKLFSEDDED